MTEVFREKSWGAVRARPVHGFDVHVGMARSLPVLLIGICFVARAADSPVGVWRGESVCATGADSCHDEKVVYYIEAVPDKADAMFIRADKIVAGKAITMGSGQWEYNRAKQTLSMETGQRLWLLIINGKRIEGTLTVPDHVVFRRMTLTRDD